jgi:hypothetical protein
MKTLTENQQSIIDAITSEFNRINSVNKSTSFNLVDASKLSSINDEIKRNKEEAEAIKKHWRQLAMDEAERLAALLQQDLPMACVERFGKSNGKTEAPSVIIQRQRGICGHHENYVSFDVVVRLGEYVHQSHNCGYQNRVGLGYEYYNTPNKSTIYNSVEELFSNSKITDDIRKKIIR